MPCDYNTISQVDVLETLETFYQQGLKEEVLQVVYEFASELTGVSVDQLMVWGDN